MSIREHIVSDYKTYTILIMIILYPHHHSVLYNKWVGGTHAELMETYGFFFFCLLCYDNRNNLTSSPVYILNDRLRRPYTFRNFVY